MISRRTFRATADLARLCSHGLWRIPREVDRVIGIPQSGMLPAALIGVQTARPVTDLEAFLAAGAEAGGTVLLVDDAVLTGATMAAAKARIAARRPDLRVLSFAVYGVVDGAADAAEGLDICLEVSRAPLTFEWSLFRTAIVARTCFDMDGIFCADCPVEDDDDGTRYRDFLARAAPLVVPRGRLGRIVTARLEKYRPETEDWLARHGIEYAHLSMLDLPSEAERRRLSPQARFKAEVYRSDPEAQLFIESETWQARAIAALAGGKPVFDYQSRELIDASQLAERGLGRRLARRARGLGARMSRRVLGRPA